jgi:peptidyl-prolyl cis-trans isomerase C
MRPLRRLSAAILIGALILSACAAATPNPTSTAPPPSPTPVPPTATPEPLAATVDGTPILLADYQAEVARFEAAHTALGIDLATLDNYRGQVLQDMIDRRLLAEGETADGGSVDPATIDQAMANLTAERGGTDGMHAWLSENMYTLDGFRAALEEETLAERKVEQIVEGVPRTAEQVHARHIVVATREQAQELLDQLQAGADFADLAATYSLDLSTRLAGGDLSWFPRGYLTMPAVEEAAFNLQPGEISGIVESDLGFDIVQTLERGEHPLTSDAWQKLGQAAVEDWLKSKRASADIQTFVAP